MKTLNKLTVYLLAVLILACSPRTEPADESVRRPHTPVQIVSPTEGSIGNDLTFLGTSAYLTRSVVNASVTGFIIDVRVKLGDNVTKDQLLYVLQTKESRALKNVFSKVDSSIQSIGVIEMRAPASGVVVTLDKQQIGDYVMEGTPLCTIAESSQLVFQINVPFEFAGYAGQGKSCTIRLPDGTVYKAKFTKALSAMNAVAQTQTILAVTQQELFLPENMIVTAELTTVGNGRTQLLQRSCVLTDEMMSTFWVVRLINDSTAVKTPVEIGHRNKEQIEIISPTFNLNDRIISVGNYGLPDTASVTIVEIEVR